MSYQRDSEQKARRGQKRMASPHSGAAVETAREWLGRKRSRNSTAVQPTTEQSSEEEEMEEESESLGEYELSQLESQVMREDGREKPVLSQREAEAGVIDRIQLNNFMCHRKLDVSLSANTNFILGRNGSGKSAIMTAIVVALGGKATTTHRASSLRNFIRTGAKSAEVILTMRNRGLDSFKADDYGDTVTVHRTIKDDGSTAYKIKAADGATVSTKKEDLVNVLDHWNIQVDNPVSLLDQDTSRHFLHSNNPTHKYKLFVKATRLEQIQQDYERAQEDQAIMKKSIGRNEELSDDLKKEAKVLEERLQLFDRLKEMEDKVRRLEMELQWAMVMELEKNVPPLEVKLAKERSRAPRHQQSITKAESKMAELDGLCEAVGKELEEVMKEAREVSQRRAEKTLERKRAEREVRELRLRQKTARGAIEDQAREESALQQKMKDLIALSQQNTAGEKARRQQMVQEAEQELKDLQSELTDLTTLKSDMGNVLRGNADRKKQVDGQRGQLNRDLREGENKVEMLQSSRSDQLLSFGGWMPRLVRTVREAETHFRKPPKGPLGVMFKLRDYRWSTAIESILGKTLSAFIVDNTYDGKTLEDIMKHELNGQKFSPDVLVSRYTGQPYDVSRKRPQTHHPTVLDMMDIEDLEVRNVLIDQCHIDTVLLIETRLEAERVIEVERPRGASVAHTIEGDQILTGRFYANKKRPLGIIKESVDSAIEEEQRRLRELETQLYNIDSKMKELQKEAAMSKEREASVRKKLLGVQRKISEVEMNLKELKSAEEEEESQEDIGTYESEIQECQSRINEMMEKKREQDRELVELKTKLEACTASLSAVEAEAEQVTGRMEEMKAKHSEYECEKQKAESVLQHYRDRVGEIDSIISSVEIKLSEEKRRAERAADDASKVCERVETRRTCKSIESEIGKFRQQIQREEPQAAEMEAVAREYTDKVELYQRTMENIRSNKKSLRELQKGLVLRLNQYSWFQDTITARACIYFKHFLQRRDYDGDLKFNHSKGTLTMEVRVDPHSRRSQVTKNTKSLSGGERSFTTVCFIMSLWEAIDSPFRCLDEFDVFMDMMNRRISMELMMESASEQRGKQFIFFTPQDMSQMGVNMGPHIRVLKLRPPERAQATLD